MSLSLGIDIDGVLSDSFGYWEQIAEREGFFGDFSSAYNGIFKVKNHSGLNFGKELFTTYHEEWLTEAKPYEGVVDTIRSIGDNPHITMYYVTARNEKTKDYTQAWLDKHGFVEAPVIYTQNKLTAPISTIIEDKLETVEQFADNARLPILIDRPYNRQREVAHRVKTLQEAYNLIRTFL